MKSLRDEDVAVESMMTLAIDSMESRALASAPDPGASVRSFCEPYRDLGLVARGGMGAVHRALDHRLGRQVAVKTIHSALAERPGALSRFVVEAQVTGALEHPGIVPVHLLGEGSDGLPMFSMKLVEGRTLLAVIHDAAGLPWPSGRLDKLVQVLLKICEAVAFAHSRGVVHCDIKPENIMVGEFGQAYLMDWGVARVVDPVAFGRDDVLPPERLADDDGTGRMNIFGTPAYMAPEQAIGLLDGIDARTDVYLLGAVLYEMLTGRPPHRGESMMAVLWDAAGGAVQPPRERAPQLGLPEGLCRTAMKALSSKPSERFDSVMELHAELERHLRGIDRFPLEHFEAGERVVTEGEAGEAAYIIVTGRVAVFKEADGIRTVLREFGPGEVFGETAVFTAKPRTASIEAVEALTVMRVTRDLLIEQIGLYSHTGAFVRALAERFRMVDARLAEVERASMIPMPATWPPIKV